MVKRWIPVAVLIPLCFALCFVLIHPVVGKSEQASSSQPAKRKLLVGVMDGPPWSMQDDDGHWSGISIDLWREIAQILDVDYEFKKYDLDGVQNAVEHGDIDVSATGLAITSERDARFDFSDPYFVFNQTVAVNADQQMGLAQVFRTTFLSVGFLNLIFAILFVTLLGAFILWFLEHKGTHLEMTAVAETKAVAEKNASENQDEENKTKKEKDKENEEQDLEDHSEDYTGKDNKAFLRALFWSVVVLGGRDLPSYIGWKTSPPKTFAGRVFGIFWMVLGILLFSLFTAGAASMLTSRQMQTIVASPEDLKHVRVGTVVGAAARDILDRRKIKYIIYENPKALVKGLADHQIDAAVYGGTTLAYYAKSYKNKITVLNFSLRQDFAAIPVPTGSPLRKSINRAILQIIESKRWQKIVEEYVTND
jgi:polar amino acid transport system substrate-binding protein